MVKRKVKSKKKSKNIFDVFHKENVCDIPNTLEEYVDPMDKLRPEKNRAKEYELTQTFAIMDKGPVKLKYTDTHGEYEWHPPDYVPPGPKKRPSIGCGPLSELLDEKWAKVVESQQLRVKVSNDIKNLESKKARTERIRRCTEKIKRKVGPDWYQELSNYQLYTVDRLAQSIIRDLKTDSVVCVTQSLQDLGVVCNSRYIASALKDCCSRPSEFLLMLYQLINHKRTKYSVTDRLLLSSIVHLSMRDTLKELHIRIPSPPPRKRRVRRPKQEPRREKYESPYLDKYLYRPPPLNKVYWGRPRREYPKNEYFEYLRELRNKTIYICADEEIADIPKFDRAKMSKKADCYTCDLIEMELNLIREWITAQTEYNKLAKTKCVPALHKASIYASCINEIEPKVISEESTEEVEEATSEVVKSVETDYVCEESTTIFCPCNMSICSEDEEEGEEEEEEEEEVEEEEKKEEQDVCNKYRVKKELEIMTEDCGCCTCKEMILAKVKATQCQCKQCEEERRRRNTASLPIIFDTTADDSGKPVQIISGTKSRTICTCLEQYTEKWKRYEKGTEIKKAQEALNNAENKFVIKGLSIDPDGKPIYVLEGVKDKEKCACYNAEKYKEEDERKEALMPHMPEGCIRYVVQGVQSTPEGNVYIVSGTTPNTDCRCMDLYYKFLENHALCLLLYGAYIRKIENEKREYFNELSPDYTDFVPQQAICARDCKQPLCPVVEEDEAQDDETECPCENMKAKIPPCPCSDEKKTCKFEPENKCQLSSAYQCAVAPEKSCQLAPYQCSETAYECAESSETTFQLAAYQCDPCEDAGSSSSKSWYCVCDEDSMDEVNKFGTFERYIILKQFPVKEKDQYTLLKKALNKLAEDGFPLAVLPDAYRLPHFRIWLMLRSKKFWTQENKSSLVSKANTFGTLMYKFKEIPTFPGCRFLLKEREKHNWNYWPLIKKGNEKIRRIFYRDVKRIELDYARILYPVIYEYEIPNRHFRDVFYSYMPSKEADIFPYNVWKKHEYREHKGGCCM